MGQTNEDDSSATRRTPHSREGTPVEIPKDIFERIRALCPALPEVTVRVDASFVAARSTAHSFDIRRRSFCLLIALEGRRANPSRNSCCVQIQVNATRYCPSATRSTAHEPAGIASGSCSPATPTGRRSESS